MKNSCMKMKFPAMIITFPLHKSKKVCPKFRMDENSKHQIVYSPISHKKIWGKKSSQGQKFHFHIFMHRNELNMLRFFLHETFRTWCISESQHMSYPSCINIWEDAGSSLCWILVSRLIYERVLKGVLYGNNLWNEINCMLPSIGYNENCLT